MMLRDSHKITKSVAKFWICMKRMDRSHTVDVLQLPIKKRERERSDEMETGWLLLLLLLIKTYFTNYSVVVVIFLWS